MYMKFKTFSKDEYPSLIISEMMDYKWSGYLNI